MVLATLIVSFLLILQFDKLESISNSKYEFYMSKSFTFPAADSEALEVGNSSKSNSIISDRSVQSVGVVSAASSQSSSTNSIPPMQMLLENDHDDPTNNFPHISIRPRARTSIVRDVYYTNLNMCGSSVLYHRAVLTFHLCASRHLTPRLLWKEFQIILPRSGRLRL